MVGRDWPSLECLCRSLSKANLAGSTPATPTINSTKEKIVCRHAVGDIVRLAKGWTPMTVIGITPDNEVIAQYGTCPDPQDLKHPEYAQSTYTRPHYGFVQWDGAPVKGSTMAKRYQIITSGVVGTFIKFTSQGYTALEFDNGSVGAFDPKDLVEFYPTTFAVKAVGGNQYKTHYIQPEGVQINKGDMLFSSSGNLYFVTDVDTKNGGNIRVFEGQRVVMAAL